VVRARAGSSEAENSYTRKLLGDRNLRLKKLGEEMAELVTACADGDRERATEEAADVVPPDGCAPGVRTRAWRRAAALDRRAH
jgi:hypothetical protein